MPLSLLRLTPLKTCGKEWHFPCPNPASRVPETRGFGENNHEGARSKTVGSPHPQQRHAGFPQLAASEDCWARRGRTGTGGHVPSVLRWAEFAGSSRRKLAVPRTDRLGQNADR